ncbi:MAG TPA: hypothetical protein PK367_02290 [Candidatus Paceibacterota bacterium]|nr:hypothetical protein [Candidatus Paceibacterota bacterium]
MSKESEVVHVNLDDRASVMYAIGITQKSRKIKYFRSDQTFVCRICGTRTNLIKLFVQDYPIGQKIEHKIRFLPICPNSGSAEHGSVLALMKDLMIVHSRDAKIALRSVIRRKLAFAGFKKDDIKENKEDYTWIPFNDPEDPKSLKGLGTWFSY